LSLKEVAALDAVVQTAREQVAIEVLLGHGWRQIELRRITAGDVRSVKDGLVLCHGKERREFAPILSETHHLLLELAGNLRDGDIVVRSERVRNGRTDPLGEDGVAQMLDRLFARAGLEARGHDLRRTFCTLVYDACGDEFLANRLIRDVNPGCSDRYLKVPLAKLLRDLELLSPLRQIRRTARRGGAEPLRQAGETMGQAEESMVETGESRTPRPEELAQDILQA
ncbi:unnamed protein product, partial [marine sediment metagenome]